jgi:phage anti-repressor protein
VGAPKIEPIDITFFKNNGTRKVNRVLKRRYEELVKEAETLQNSYFINQEVYDSNYKFEPVIGEIYHLYEDSDGAKRLSLIAPNEWTKKYLYSVVLNSDMTWEKII